MAVARFCVKCGVENTAGLDACSNCGSSLVLGVPMPTPPMPPRTPAPIAYPALPPTPMWGAPPPIVKRATVGTILSDTLSTFGKDFAVYIGIFLIYAAATTLGTLGATALVFGSPSGSVDLPASTGPISINTVYLFIALLIAISVLGLAIQSILTATLTVFAVHRHQGKDITLGEAFRLGLPKVLSVLGASILPGLLLGAVFAAVLGILLYGAITTNLGLVCGAGVLLLLMIPVTIYITIALSLFAPPIVIEGQGAIGGLRRSWQLTQGRRLTLFAVFIVLGLLSIAITVAASIPFFLGTNPYIASLGGIISTAITGSWTLIMAAVAYNLITSSGASPPGFGQVPAATWPPRS